MKKLFVILFCLILSLGLIACKGEAVTCEDEAIKQIDENTPTTVYIGNEKYTFMGNKSVTLTKLLRDLEYDLDKVCNCLPEYTVDTIFGKGYGINLTASYVKYNGGQVELTFEQLDEVKEIIEWVKAQKPKQKFKVTKGEIYSDFGGIKIKIKEINLGVAKPNIIVDWVNKTVYEVIYGESYAIERYENGKWVSCQKASGEPTFHAIGIVLKPNTTQEKTYSFDGVFDVSKEGKYRIITDCYVYNNGREFKAQKCNLLAEFTVNRTDNGNDESRNYQNYSFSLTWGTQGISSYDSKTETLIKDKDATNPKEYTNNLKLTEQQYSAIWKLIEGLDIESYPDEYNPHDNVTSNPYLTLILSVKTDDLEKTVTVKETALSYESENQKGQKFLDACKGIEDILTETKEWKSLPEYEYLYN